MGSSQNKARIGRFTEAIATTIRLVTSLFVFIKQRTHVDKQGR